LSILNGLFENASGNKNNERNFKLIKNFYNEKEEKYQNFYNLVNRKLDGLAEKLIVDNYRTAQENVKQLELERDNMPEEKDEKINNLNDFIIKIRELVNIDYESADDIKVYKDEGRLIVPVAKNSADFYPLALADLKEEIINELDLEEVNLTDEDKETITAENDLGWLLILVKNTLNK
jgi:hypothetical protein